MCECLCVCVNYQIELCLGVLYLLRESICHLSITLLSGFRLIMHLMGSYSEMNNSIFRFSLELRFLEKLYFYREGVGEFKMS